MEYKYQYTDDNSKQDILNTHTDKFLIREENIAKGNYLVFADEKPLANQIQDLNNTSNMILLKQEGII